MTVGRPKSRRKPPAREKEARQQDITAERVSEEPGGLRSREQAERIFKPLRSGPRRCGLSINVSLGFGRPNSVVIRLPRESDSHFDEVWELTHLPSS